jgi:hypothetical protein
VEIGRQVRVKRGVEELVELVADWLGYEAFTVRNVALLHGLLFVALNKDRGLPGTDQEFEQMLRTARRVITSLVVEDRGEGRG